MKTSNVIASLLFGSLAAAVPVKRDLYTTTEMVVETVVVFTTVWDDGSAPTVATTTAAGAFYEQPSQAASSAAKTTSTSAYVAPVVESSTSVYIAATSNANPQPQSTTSVYTPPAAPTSQAPASQAPAASSSVYTPPSPVSSAAAATSLSASTSSTGSGQTYSGGDLTVYDTYGGTGMCGTTLSDSALTVAISEDIMGARKTDVMTGNAVNEMCGKKIAITYKGNTIEATINDLCGDCIGSSLDLTRGAWKALTGNEDTTRYVGFANWKVIG